MPQWETYWCIIVAKNGVFLFADFGALLFSSHTSITVSGTNQPVVSIVADYTVKIQIINISSIPDKDIEYGMMKSYMQELASNMRGVHTGMVTNGWSFDQKTKKTINNLANGLMSTTYSVNVTFEIQIIHSVDELDNKAIVIGLVDKLSKDKGDRWGVADPFAGIALIDVGVLSKTKMTTYGGKVSKHELGHLFGLLHNSKSASVMSSGPDKGRHISEQEATEMIFNAIGPWNYIYDNKVQGQPLDISNNYPNRNVKKDFTDAVNEYVQ